MTGDCPGTIWISAQEAERLYWAKRCSDPVGVMYEMGEHLDLAWRLRSCSSTSPRSVLDVGVGPMGTGLLWLFSDARVKIGVDTLQRMPVATGNRYADQLVEAIRSDSRYIVGRAERLPFGDEAFDVVVCNNVLDHVDRPLRVLSEVCRVVRPGGYLGLGLDTNSYLGYFVRRVDRLLRPSLNTYRLHPTDFVIGYIEQYLSDRHFIILSSNEASGPGRLGGRRRMQCWVAIKRPEGSPSGQCV